MTKQSWRKGSLALAVSAALAFGASPLYASGETDGTVNGLVQTVSGQAMAGVTVQAKNVDTGLVRTAETDAAGDYRLPQLPIGKYEITVTQNGKVVGKQSVTVKLGGVTDVSFDLADTSNAEMIEVVGARPSAIDLTETNSGLSIGEAELDRLPVARNTSDIALLAPGVLRGDRQFGNLPSFGGSSVQENTFYINGFNITDLRRYQGGGSVPFEFYKQFEVKTGGYGAEFGRSTGGVVNAVTKSGTNEFTYGFNAYWEPASLRAKDPAVYSNTNGRLFLNPNDEISTTNYNIEVGGPIIQDKLFFYALVNPSKTETLDAGETREMNSESGSTFWGGKIDWYIAEDHQVEFTVFDSSDTTENVARPYKYDADGFIPGTFGLDSSLPNQAVLSERVWRDEQNSGGLNTILRYSGQLSDDLSLQVLYGRSVNDTSVTNRNGNYAFVQNRTSFDANGAFVGRVQTTGRNRLDRNRFDEDIRSVLRGDLTWYVADHKLKAGFDWEEAASETDVTPVGPRPFWYQYRFASPSSTIPGTLRVFRYSVDGGYDTTGSALYISDEWNVTDRLFLSLGLRNETFDNKNVDGDTFIELKDQLAPRLAASFDLFGDGRSKVYANWGRYYIPIPNNTNVRAAGNEEYLYRNFGASTRGICWTYNPGGDPNLDLSNPACAVNFETADTILSPGITPIPESVSDQKGLKPMYQEETILGYATELSDSWAFNMRYVYRDMKTAIDDMDVGAGLYQWAVQNNISMSAAMQTRILGGHYMLGNPGETQEIYWDFQNGNGPVLATLTNDLLGNFEKPVRKYKAWEFVLDHRWDGNYSLNASYTWAHSYGNYEGYSRSDNGQNDAGITTLYDYAQLNEGSYGDLPNDRRHQFKINGAFAIAENLTFSFNATAVSGRPKNCFGVHPDAHGAANSYGAASFYCTTNTSGDVADYDDGIYIDEDGEEHPGDLHLEESVLSQRGSFGRTPWIYNLDIGLAYDFKVAGGDANVRFDIFNVLNDHGAENVNETGDITDLHAGGVGTFYGVKDPDYGLPTAFQNPRSARISVGIRF